MTQEFPLYSDARFTGDAGDEKSPYLLLNTVPDSAPGTLVPALVLRFGIHLPEVLDELIDALREGIADDSGYTGGTPSDEFASLVSLAHSVRLAVGTESRSFLAGARDLRGRPRYYSLPSPPALLVGRGRDPIPTMQRVTPLTTDLLGGYPDIAWESARELTRAARSYRQAVWVAWSDGNLAWLFLVSAAETAANEWARIAHLSEARSALLEHLRPDLVRELRAAAGDSDSAVVDVVARHFNSILKAQWKFQEFLVRFGLEPPQLRPSAWPIDWTEAPMRDTLKTIYGYRSRALHGGRPFPSPMCDAPYPSEDRAGNRAWSERPPFGTTSTHGAVWTSKDLPMNLYAFHHLVATALTKWWRTLTSSSGA